MDQGNESGNPPRDVLVVEDDPEINRLVGAYVEMAGYHYVSALDGSQAFAEVRRHPPSAIVLDLMLPDFNGLEICRRLKKDRDTHQIPVIILTAMDNEDSRQQGMECGADEYLTKPFDPDVLLDVLQRHLGSEEEAPTQQM